MNEPRNAIQSRRTAEFKRQFDQLPPTIQKLTTQKYQLFLRDPNHPSFRVQRIQSTKDHPYPHYEYSITMDYRAACFKDGNTYVWIFIGKHSEFDKRF
jgi:hypothetical protein